MLPRRTFLLLVFSFTALAAPKLNPARALANIDPWVAEAMRELHVPGAALGVVYDGQVVFAKGYGVRRVAGRQPVTADTVFAVGSLTKSFTAVVAATLVDQKRLEWDRPVRDYLPGFRLYDPVATELITLRDLLTHRSGLPRHDMIRFTTHLERGELVRRLRHLEPNRTFRDVYQYNNLMYVTAGFLEGEVAGSSWEQLVQDRVFGPLGMASSSVDSADMQRGQDYAHPHVTKDGLAAETAFYRYQPFGVGPNGAVNSSVKDLLRYLQLHLDGGLAEGKQVVSKAQMAQLHRPVTVVSADRSYALGWQVGSHHGHRIIEHGGAITGFTAHASMFPEERLGIVVLNNLDSGLPGMLAEVVANRIFEIDAPDPMERQRQNLRTRIPARPAPPRVANTKPSLPLIDYAGSYRHPAYGTVRVETSGDGLKVVFDTMQVTLRHWNFDTFTFGTGSEEFARFELDAAGRVSQLALPLEPAVKALVFTRVSGSTP